MRAIRTTRVLALLLIVLVGAVWAVRANREGFGARAAESTRVVRGAGEATPPVDPDWMNSVEASISAREYWASDGPAGLQAPNRRNDLRTFFEPDGIRVHDRDAQVETRLVGLSLVEVGRGGALDAVPPGEVTHHEGRVEIARRELALVEWFENGASGLEQGFDLARRPAVDVTSPLVLELAVEEARAAIEESTVVLTTVSGRRLSYGGLLAEDAAGVRLASHFEVDAPDRIRLIIDDRGAAYPIRIDPILTGAADRQIESNQSSALLGESVAGAGDVNGDGYADLIVGAYLYDNGQADEGAAFVFLGSSSGITGTQPGQAAAVLESNQINAGFGYGVASAGDVNGDGYADVLVGSYLYDKGETDEGAAFVFLGSATGIASGSPLTAATTLESNQAVSIFGLSVASAGDVNGDGFADVVVGAPGYSDGESTEGAAFVFMGSATGIANGNPANAAALIESNQAFSGLGFAVSGAGDVNGDGFGDLIVGDGFYNRGELHEGAAFVHLGNTAGRPSLARQRRGDGSGVAVQSFGLSRSSTSFVAELRAGHPQVAGRIKAQWQACPAGVAFGSPICTNVVSPTWVGVNRLTPEATIAQTIPGLADRTLYHWRARALFAPKTGPLPANPPHSPWRRLAAQSVEGDIRVPEPRIDVALLAGILVMAGLAKTRSRFDRAH